MLVETESTQSESAVQTDTFDARISPEEDIQFKDGIQPKTSAVPYSAMQFPMSKGPHGWKKRPRSPGLKWYKAYDTPESLTTGRVLVIDYVKQGTGCPKKSTSGTLSIGEHRLKCAALNVQTIVKSVCARWPPRRSVQLKDFGNCILM